MPELPEVETIARGMDERVRGDRIVESWFSRSKEPFKTSAGRMAKGLEGQTILSVHRTGKHVVFELGDVLGARNHASQATAQWVVHLGMTGRLLVTRPDAPAAIHTHARLLLGSGREIRFVDARRFGRLEYRRLSAEPAFRAAGKEPMTIGAEEFAGLFRGRKTSIKAALLNQTLLSGVGNIYADESLYQSGIRPGRRAGRLSRKELDQLLGALQQVLTHAIGLGGSSVSNYVNADGVRGFFQLEHFVYRRAGEPCHRCKTPIKRVLIGGRGTHYCPRCQA